MADDAAQTTTAPADGDWKSWLSRIAASRRRREDLVSEWQENTDKRRGKRDETDSHATRVAINQDWPLTKAKIAQLYSQTPEVRLTPRSPEFQQAVPFFGRVLNDTITDASVGTAIEEVLADVVNASGIGGVLVSCEQRTELRDVPAADPALLVPGMEPPAPVQVPVPVDTQYLVSRISPAQLLIPSDFTGSNYDQARWLGHESSLTWPQAQAAFGLDDAVKDKVLGADKRASGVNHSLNTDTTKYRDTEVVNYTEIFYWRHFYHAGETSFKALQRLVFVDGLEEPVIDEPYAGQRTAQGRVVGVTENPIRILTLTYISDDSLPPSDSSISRYQVDELEQSRDAMVQQRKHSIPIRWVDSNRVSSGTKSLLEKGTFQGFIATNGPGDRAVGEVSRASFPQEKFEFDKIIKGDLTEIWQVGTNQSGAFAQGERSASEARIIQQNFQTRVGQERDKVTKFFVGVARVLAGHLALYGQFEIPEDVIAGIGGREAIAGGFSYAVHVDSTVLLDADAQIERLQRGLNLTAQSGYVNPKPVIAKIWELLGEDPNAIVIDPQPKSPEPVSLSGGAQDMANPVFLAALSRTQQLPTPEDVSAVAKLLEMLGAIPGMASLVAQAQPAPAGDPNAPPSEVQTPEMANAGWEAAPRIERRAADGGA